MVKKLTNIKERVLYFSKHQGVTIEKFLASIDMTYGSFKGEAKKRSLNSDAIEKILNKYPNVNPVWLLTGEGEMELSHETLIDSATTKNQINKEEILITPLISKYFQKEFSENFNNGDYIKTLNKVPWINNLGIDSSKFKTFEVKGDKMDDNSPQSFLDGDLILVMEIDYMNWSNLKKSKSSYVILHKEMGVLICRISNFSENESHIICNYLNHLYQGFQMDMKDILTVFKIVELRREPRF